MSLLLERLRALPDGGGPLVHEPFRPPLTLRDRGFWDRVDPAARRYWVQRGEKYRGFEFPALSPEMYEEYRRTGDRQRFEAAYHRRRQVVSTLLLAEGCENEGRFVPTLLEGLRQICDEPTWVLPAHAEGLGLEPEAPAIDIFSAETGNLLAWILHILGEAPVFRGSPLFAKVEEEVRRRLLEPYLGRTDFWWMGFDGQPVRNWTTWCTSNCLGTLLLREGDPARRRRGIEKACASLDRFLDAYSEDGGCDEGPTYWNFAAGCLFDSLEMLHAASRGALDAFEDPAVARLGRYVREVHVHDLHFVNFADSPPEVPVDAALVYRYGRRTGDAALKALGIHLYGLLERRDPESTIRLKLSRALATLPDETALRSPAPPLRASTEAWFGKLQVSVVREHERPGEGFLLAAKGGHNDEGHNHNDVGNVVVYLAGRPVLVDVGMKQYSRESFGDGRYDIWAMQSAYHNVPVVNGVFQAPGREFEARGARPFREGAVSGFSADIARAYPEAAGLTAWERRSVLDRSAREVRIQEAFSFRGGANRYELRFLSPLRPVSDGDRLLFLLEGDRAVSLVTRPRPSRTLRYALTLRDRVLQHAWGGLLYQVRLSFEDVPSRGECTTVLRPATWGRVEPADAPPLVSEELP